MTADGHMRYTAIKFYVTETTPELRDFYRRWRTIGLDRHSTNTLLAGMCLADPRLGEVHARRPRSSPIT